MGDIGEPKRIIEVESEPQKTEPAKPSRKKEETAEPPKEPVRP